MAKSQSLAAGRMMTDTSKQAWTAQVHKPCCHCSTGVRIVSFEILVSLPGVWSLLTALDLCLDRPAHTAAANLPTEAGQGVPVTMEPF